MKNILVTGGCGFIGSNFIRLVLGKLSTCRIINLDKLTYAGNLQNLEDVTDNPNYSFIRGDICDADLLSSIFREEQIDTVVHFAAESHVDRSIDGPSEFMQTNIMGTFTLLEAARESWVDPDLKNSNRFLHVSTDEVYGSLGETGSFREDTAFDPHSPYSASKASSDHLVSAYFHTYGLPVLITNCSNNYGPYQFPEKLIPLMINNALHGKELPVYGKGENVRDWLYVVDHCQAILDVLETGVTGETYNIGGDSEKANIEVVHAICDIVDELVSPLASGESRRSLIRFVTDRPGHDWRYAIDASKIKNEIGWKPSVRFEEGLRNTIRWYLDNLSWSDAVQDGTYQDYYDKMYSNR